MASTNQLESIVKAEELLVDWIKRDIETGHSSKALLKQMDRAYMTGLLIHYARKNNLTVDESVLIEQATMQLAEVESAIDKNPETNDTALIANLAQTKSFVSGVGNDFDGVLKAQEE